MMPASDSPTSASCSTSAPASFWNSQLNQDTSLHAPEAQYHALYNPLYTPSPPCDPSLSVQPYPTSFAPPAYAWDAAPPDLSLPFTIYPPVWSQPYVDYSQTLYAPQASTAVFVPPQVPFGPIPPIPIPFLPVEDPVKKKGGRKAKVPAEPKKTARKVTKPKSPPVKKPRQKAERKPKAPRKPSSKHHHNAPPPWYTNDALFPIITWPSSASFQAPNPSEQQPNGAFTPSGKRQIPSLAFQHNTLSALPITCPPSQVVGPLTLVPTLRSSTSGSKKSKGDIASAPVRPRSAGTVKKATPLQRHGPKSSPALDRLAQIVPSHDVANGGLPGISSLQTPPGALSLMGGETPKGGPPLIDRSTRPRLAPSQQSIVIPCENGLSMEALQYWNRATGAAHEEAGNHLTIDSSLQDVPLPTSTPWPASASTAAFPQTPLPTVLDTATLASCDTLPGWSTTYTSAYDDIHNHKAGLLVVDTQGDGTRPFEWYPTAQNYAQGD